MFIDYITLMLINMVAGLFYWHTMSMLAWTILPKQMDSWVWNYGRDRTYHWIAHDINLDCQRQFQYCIW
ncbi:MAG: hypothetical protein CLLPBCKN_005443 [Chroococcidiopsis cubana SAG 39.79]|nr:hypothetical protein [Chroococcidiopsis cubana SAG 39.79]